MFFSWQQIKNDASVTLYVSFDKKRQCYPLCFFAVMTDENILFDKDNFFKYVTPYILIDKNNSVTPYVFFHDDQ